MCDSRTIKRLPSAPRLNLTSAPTSPEQTVQEFQKHWMAIARKVIADTEDVGERFAEEARRIHYQEVPERGIRGIVTPDEREALAEEGIEVLSLPIPANLKQPLQ